MLKSATLTPTDYRDKLLALGNFYVDGYDIDWQQLYQGEAHRKLSLPTYPFAKDHYWIETKTPAEMQTGVASLHPFVDANISTMEAECFIKTFTGNEFYLADHRVNGQPVLPGVAYIEMARAVGELASPAQWVTRLKDIVWVRPIRIEGDAKPVQIHIYPEAAQVYFEVTSESEKPILHAQGKIIYGLHPTAEPEIIDIDALKKRCTKQQTREEIYAAFANTGLHYGPSFQVIDRLFSNETEALAELVLPTPLQDGQFLLHPSLMDGALQSVLGLMKVDSEEPPHIYLLA